MSAVRHYLAIRATYAQVVEVDITDARLVRERNGIVTVECDSAGDRDLLRIVMEVHGLELIVARDDFGTHAEVVDYRDR